MPARAEPIPERLPLLDALVAQQAGERPLEGAHAVLIQHQLGALVPTTQALFDLGLDPRRTHVLDIPYTANETVRSALEALGIPARNFAPSNYNLELAYAAYQRRRVQDLALRLRAVLEPGAPLLVLDDGAYFAEAMSCFAEPLPNVRVVEQTTRGLIKLASDPALAAYAAGIPIVDVAGSRPKSRFEGPEVGVAICESLHAQLDGKAPFRGGDVLVLGYGTIGRAVASSLTGAGVHAGRIFVSDPSPAARRAAVRAGHGIWSRAEARRFSLVVGCSGTTSFSIGDRVYLDDGAVLASASSGSAELSRELFIELADTHPSDDIYVVDRESLPRRSIHDAIEIHLVDRRVRFLNGGFPVNFDGSVNSVPPELIQVTHALQVGGAIQALRAEQSGLLPLDRALCRWVERTFPKLAAVD
jgi:S-adenosylhomocysteine hydrolase